MRISPINEASRIWARSEHGLVHSNGKLYSPSGVSSIWLRYDPACFKDRLQALEKHFAETRYALTGSQVQALERKQEEKEAHRGIETEHPGYFGSQDTFYVGRLKGGSYLSTDFRGYV